MASTEQQLLKRARAGDSAAMDELLARNEKSVYRFGVRMCRSEEAARDVLQQTLLTAFKSLHHFRGEARLSSWLFQIARTHCTRSQRSEKTTVPIDSREALGVTADGPSPEDRTLAREIGEALSAAIFALPEKHREALLLRDVEGMSAEQAAEALGIPVANLKTRLHRARKELRHNLMALRS